MAQKLYLLPIVALAIGACSSEPPSPQFLVPIAGPPALVRGPTPFTPDDFRCLSAIRVYQSSLDDREAGDIRILRERMEIACSPPRSMQAEAPGAQRAQLP